MKAVKARLLKQIREIQNSGQTLGLTIQYDQNNIQHLIVSMIGPEGTLYQGGIFFMQFICNQYPWKAPKCYFRTPIYNPVIQRSGLLHCCFAYGDQWNPTVTIIKIVNKYREYLYVQNLTKTNSCFGNDQMHNQFINNYQQFKRKAKLWTKKYANKESFYKNAYDFIEQGQNVNVLNLNKQDFFCKVQSIRDQQCLKLSKANLPNLSILKINIENITEVGIAHIFHEKAWPQLKQLSINENKNIKNGKLGKYLTIPIWTNLRIVKIDSCKMYQIDIKRLIKSNWPHLIQLYLDFNSKCLQILSKASWKQLQKLDFGYESFRPIQLFNLFLYNLPKLSQMKISVGFRNYQISKQFKDFIFKQLKIPQGDNLW